MTVRVVAFGRVRELLGVGERALTVAADARVADAWAALTAEVAALHQAAPTTRVARNGAIAAVRPAAPVGTPGGGAAAALPGRAALKKLAGIGGCGPKRPPDRLSQPVILSLKNSVRTSRLEVMPPCECPTSQKARMFCLPT